MRKLWTILPLVLLLGGCGSDETMETVSDEWLKTVMASPRNIAVQLPESAAAPVMESETEQVYLCEDYEIIMETCASGDMNATVKHVSGYEKDRLTILQTSLNGIERYEFVWVTAGEQGERLGRAVILDDGQYHYCLSTLRDAQRKDASEVVWNDMFASFQLT